MKKVYKYKENRNLRTGEVYKFWIIKKLKFPGGIDYFVMQDPYGDKHLLPARYYEHYNIQIQQYYYCRVDKVNCQGRLFFEPVHPTFQVGNSYLFGFKKMAVLVSKNRSLTQYFLMKNENGESAYLPFDTLKRPQKGKFELYTVVKIKKAKIFLQKNEDFNTNQI